MKLHIIDEAERCLKCKKPLCQQGCPIHTPIPQITQFPLSAPPYVTMKINVKAIVF